MNLLTVKQVAEKLSCAVSHVWLMLKKDPTFPKPISIGMGGEHARGTRWVDGAISEWMLAKHSLANKNQEVLTDEDRRSGTQIHTDTREEVAA